MRLVDSHCHLNADRFEVDVDLVVGGARLAGVERILVPGWNVASSARALDCVDRFDWLDAAVGIHPHDAAKVDGEGWARIIAWAADPRVVAIGETGLDYDRVFSPIPEQLTNLRRNLALALDTGKPAILHCRSRDGRRDAQDALLWELRAAGVGGPSWAAAFGDRPAAIIHSFSGPLDYARSVIDLGLAVSFSGLVFRRGEEASGEAAAIVPGVPSPGRDRFAVPLGTGCATLAKRTGVGTRHSGMGRRAPSPAARGDRIDARRCLRRGLPVSSQDSVIAALRRSLRPSSSCSWRAAAARLRRAPVPSPARPHR